MATTKYLWDDETDTVVMEKDGTGTTKAVYHSDPVPYGKLFSMRRDGKTSNYRYDGQGNTRALTDETGKTTDTYSYGAFGTQRTQTGTTVNPYRYGGQHGYQHNEATGDYYIRARVYEPTQSRWLSKDPLMFIDGLNWYLYVSNSASQHSDSTGTSIQAGHIKGPCDAIKIVETAVKHVNNGGKWKDIKKIMELIKKANHPLTSLASLVNSLAMGPHPQSTVGAALLQFSDKNWALARISASFWAGVNDDASNQFVFTCNCGWLDMGHFWASALGGANLPPSTTYIIGVLVEVFQEKSPDINRLLFFLNKGNLFKKSWIESAWTKEDLSTDYFGSTFGESLTSGKTDSILSKFRELLK